MAECNLPLVVVETLPTPSADTLNKLYGIPCVEGNYHYYVTSATCDHNGQVKYIWNKLSTICTETDIVSSTTDEDRKRWETITKEWRISSYKERIKYFIETCAIINMRDSSISNWSEDASDEIAEAVYNSCRTIKDIKFDMDHHGAPIIMIIFNKLDLDSMPDKAIAEEIKAWGKKHGFININDHHCHRCHDVINDTHNNSNPLSSGWWNNNGCTCTSCNHT